MHIRRARNEDARRIAAIFNYEVEHAVSNYEGRRHSAEERAEWIERLQRDEYPVFVAVQDELVVGFGALTPFHSLLGYRFTVSGSIYVDGSARGSGVGRQIASALFTAARERGYHSVLAGVNSENEACISLLKSFGFEIVGRFREIGWKQGKWHDDVCLQLILPAPASVLL